MFIYISINVLAFLVSLAQIVANKAFQTILSDRSQWDLSNRPKFIEIGPCYSTDMGLNPSPLIVLLLPFQILSLNPENPTTPLDGQIFPKFKHVCFSGTKMVYLTIASASYYVYRLLFTWLFHCINLYYSLKFVEQPAAAKLFWKLAIKLW